VSSVHRYQRSILFGTPYQMPSIVHENSTYQRPKFEFVGKRHARTITTDFTGNTSSTRTEKLIETVLGKTSFQAMELELSYNRI